MGEGAGWTDDEFRAATKMFLEYQAEQKEAKRKYDEIRELLRKHMETKDLKTKVLDVDGKPYRVTWVQDTLTTWEAEKVQKVLEPKVIIETVTEIDEEGIEHEVDVEVNLWEKVQVVKIEVDPNLIPPLIEKELISFEEAQEMATISTKKAFVKVSAAKGD